MRWVPVVLGLATAGPLPAQTLHYEGSAGLTTGTYIFTTRTSSWSIGTGAALGVGPLTFRASLPMFYQNTSLVAVAGPGYVPTGGSSGSAVSRGSSRRASLAAPLFDQAAEAQTEPLATPTSAVTGYRWAAGDPFVGVTAMAPRLGPVGLIVGVTAKVPVTDTASAGTGAWDVGGSISLVAALGPRVLLGADAGYWFMGDAPTLVLENPVVFGGTVSVLAGGRWGLSAGVSGATATIAGYGPSVVAVVSALRLTGAGSVGISATAGLTETAPDVGVMLTWRVGLVR